MSISDLTMDDASRPEFLGRDSLTGGEVTKAGGAKTRRRHRLAEAQNWRCAYCTGVMAADGSGPDCATVDHLIPLAWGGRRHDANRIAACRACNNVRGSDLSCWQFRKQRKRGVRDGAWMPCTYPSARVTKRFRALAVAAASRRTMRRLSAEIKSQAGQG